MDTKAAGMFLGVYLLPTGVVLPYPSPNLILDIVLLLLFLGLEILRLFYG